MRNLQACFSLHAAALKLMRAQSSVLAFFLTTSVVGTFVDGNKDYYYYYIEKNEPFWHVMTVAHRKILLAKEPFNFRCHTTMHRSLVVDRFQVQLHCYRSGQGLVAQSCGFFGHYTVFSSIVYIWQSMR